MTPAAYLLAIPDDYAVELSRLRWALENDAIETDGGTSLDPVSLRALGLNGGY